MSERFPDVDWWCDRCGGHLNGQFGFDDHRYTWGYPQIVDTSRLRGFVLG